MESYEKIKKMAEISKELKKHGLAKNSDEALQQAEDMILQKKGEKVKNGEVYVPHDKYEIKENKEEPDPELKLRKLTAEFNEKVNAMSSELALVRNKINEMVGKINDLEAKMANQQKQEVQATLVGSQEEEKEEPKKEEPSREAPGKITPEVKKEYTQDDVAVDKVFYVGKK